MHFLPPYSPNFNAIEVAFSKMKALLRKAAARTLPPLREAIRDAIDAVTSGDARSFLTACEDKTEWAESALVAWWPAAPDHAPGRPRLRLPTGLTRGTLPTS